MRPARPILGPIVLAALLLAATGGSARADIYRWVDAAGRTHFSDTPPPLKARQVSRDDSVTPTNDLPYATRRAAETFPVVLYTSSDCGEPCQQARQLLDGRGVPFTEKRAEKGEEQAELKQLVGDLFVPSLKVGPQKTRGFEASQYDKLLDLAGYPKSAPAARRAPPPPVGQATAQPLAQQSAPSPVEPQSPAPARP